MQFLATMEKLVLRYYNFFLEGVRNTLIIAFFAVLLGTLLGTLMAMARMSRIKPLKWIATAYIEFFRGTPLMVQLMFIFYGLPMIGVAFPSVSFIPDFDRFAAGIVAMSLNSCAYVAEIIRAALESVPAGQMEAGRCVGMTYLQTMRRIILPQAMRTAFPSLSNSLISMIKDTSLAANITVTEMFMATQRIVARTYEPLALYIEVGLIYLLFCTVLTKLQSVGEKRLNAHEYRGG